MRTIPPLTLTFMNLADRQDMIPVVTNWYYDEWGDPKSENSYEMILERVKSQLSRDSVPLTILALQNTSVVGVAQLKMQEMKTYPEDTYWLGGVFVKPEVRGRSVGTALVHEIIRLAKSFGVTKLYLQTEQFDGGIYKKSGFNPLERVIYKGIDVLVMEMKLK